MTPLFYEQSSSRALPDRTEGEGRGGPPSSTRYRHQIPSPSNILDSRILLIGRIGEENRRDDVSEEEEEKKKLWFPLSELETLSYRDVGDRERVRETDFYEWGTLNDVVKTSNRDFLENS